MPASPHARTTDDLLAGDALTGDALTGDALTGKRVLVTGASGFIGSRLVERLSRAGASVTAVSRTPGRLANDDRFASCDLTSEAETAELFARCAPQIVFHFASHPDGRESYAQARRTIETNLIGTLNVLEALRRACGDAELLIYGDSCKVYGDSPAPYAAGVPVAPLGSYAITKAAGWNLCDLYARLHGTPVVSVRPTLIYGPGQNHNLIAFVAESVLGGKPEVMLDGGSQTRDPLFIDDALEAFLLVARRGRALANRVINIGGGSEHTVCEIAELIVRLMNSAVPVVALHAGARPTDCKRSRCDNSEAAELLGWQPRTDLATGLRRTIEHIALCRAAAAAEAPPATAPQIAMTGITPAGATA